MEKELKWIVSDVTVFEQILIKYKANIVSKKNISMSAIYYDTVDGFLSSNKSGLRIRKENDSSICCLKCSIGDKDGLFVREEYECGADNIREGIRTLIEVGAPKGLCETILQKGIFEICKTNFQRTAVIINHEGCLSELSFDIGTLEKKGKCLDFAEIELEYISGNDQSFLSFGNKMREEFHLTPQILSKLARALAL